MFRLIINKSCQRQAQNKGGVEWVLAESAGGPGIKCVKCKHAESSEPRKSKAESYNQGTKPDPESEVRIQEARFWQQEMSRAKLTQHENKTQSRGIFPRFGFIFSGS